MIIKSRRAHPIMKQSYAKPAVIHTEKLEARAVTCAKADDTSILS